MKNEDLKEKNYYEQKRDELIEKLRLAVDQCLEIIGEDIDKDISDDKKHNVLKGKRVASEDAEHYMGQIKKYENERDGVVEDTNDEKPKEKKNWSSKMAVNP